MRTFTVLFRNGQVARVSGNQLEYPDGRNVVEVWAWEDSSGRSLVGVFELTQIQGVFAGEIEKGDEPRHDPMAAERRDV
jgi:hypothetical protein